MTDTITISRQLLEEIKTPINGILGFSEIIKDEMIGEVGNKDYVDYSQDIYNCGTHMMELINKILVGELK